MLPRSASQNLNLFADCALSMSGRRYAVCRGACPVQKVFLVPADPQGSPQDRHVPDKIAMFLKRVDFALTQCPTSHPIWF